MHGEMCFSSVSRFGFFYSSRKVTGELHEQAVPCIPRNTVQGVSQS